MPLTPPKLDGIPRENPPRRARVLPGQQALFAPAWGEPARQARRGAAPPDEPLFARETPALVGIVEPAPTEPRRRATMLLPAPGQSALSPAEKLRIARSPMLMPPVLRSVPAVPAEPLRAMPHASPTTPRPARPPAPRAASTLDPFAELYPPPLTTTQEPLAPPPQATMRAGAGPTQVQSAPTTRRIPAAAVPSLVKKLEAIARRAARYGVPPPTWTVGEVVREEREQRNTRGDKWIELRLFRDVTVHGKTPRLPGGWRLVARLDPTPAGTIVAMVPGAQPPPVTYRAAPSHCDYCNTKRLRAKTYLLVSEAGEWKQVGSTCLEAFLGGESPDAALGAAEMLYDMDAAARDAEESGGGGWNSQADAWAPIAVLTAAACIVRTEGKYIARASAGFTETPTADLVRLWLIAPEGSKTRKEMDAAFKIMPQDEARAAAALEWINTELDRTGEFGYNVFTLAQAGYVREKHIGMMVGALAGYMRAKGIELSAKLAARPASEWVGKVGEKIVDVPVTVQRTHQQDSEFGVRTLFVMVGDDGAVYKWFTGGNFDDETMAQGARLLILVATIKAHETYKDKKQTVLTRVTFARKRKTIESEIERYEISLEHSQRLAAEGKSWAAKEAKTIGKYLQTQREILAKLDRFGL